jgi:hypothetical protein
MLDTAVGGFAVDAAADQYNHLCETWYGPGSEHEDALAVKTWASPAWCNPPYTRDGITDWLKKFREQGYAGVNVVALIPASVETEWWYEHVAAAVESGAADLIFLKGRVMFQRPCSHCDGSGTCRMVLEGLGHCCDIEGDLCEVCGGKGSVSRGAPRFPSAIVIYGPTAMGKVGWLDWRKRAEVSSDGDADVAVGSDGPERRRKLDRFTTSSRTRPTWW